MTFSRTWEWPEFIEFQSGHWKIVTFKIIVYIFVDHFARAGKFGKILSSALKSAVAALPSNFCKQSLKKTKYTRNWVWNHIIFALIYENLLQILPAEEYTTCKRNGCVKLRQEESGLGSEEPISVPTLLQDAAAAYPDVSTHLFPKELYFEGYRKVGKEKGSSFWFRTSLQVHTNYFSRSISAQTLFSMYVDRGAQIFVSSWVTSWVPWLGKMTIRHNNTSVKVSAPWSLLNYWWMWLLMECAKWCSSQGRSRDGAAKITLIYSPKAPANYDKCIFPSWGCSSIKRLFWLKTWNNLGMNLHFRSLHWKWNVKANGKPGLMSDICVKSSWQRVDLFTLD